MKFKSFLLLVLIFCLGCAASNPSVQSDVNRGNSQPSTSPVLPWSSGELRIGYIRSDVIVSKFKDYDDADRQLKTDNQNWLDESEDLERKINELEAEQDELGLILSEERARELERSIVDARKALQKFKQDTWYDDNSKYLKRRRELMEPIDAKVNDIIWRVAEESNLDLVFDTVAGNILYVKPEFDLTERVLEELER